MFTKKLMTTLKKQYGQNNVSLEEFDWLLIDGSIGTIQARDCGFAIEFSHDIKNLAVKDNVHYATDSQDFLNQLTFLNI